VTVDRERWACPHRLLVARRYPPLGRAMAQRDSRQPSIRAPQAGMEQHSLGFDHGQVLPDSGNVRYFGIHSHL